MRYVTSAALLLLLLTSISAQGNLVENGDSEKLENGAAVGWQAAGEAARVSQELTVDAGREGGHCLKLDCTRFTPGSPSAHAMICQMGRVAVEQGKTYQVSFWARQRGLDEQPVSVALSETKGWANLGLTDSFLATGQWRQYRFRFRATATEQANTRLQIWYTTTGTLWLDDVVLTPGDFAARPTLVWPAAGGRNLVPNAGFELGTDGWGSTGELAPSRGWPSRLNTLVGQVVEQGHGGGRCLQMSLSPETVPVSYFDYYGMTRAPLRTLLAGTTGFLELQADKQYTLSAWLRADRDRAPVLLAVQPFGAGAVQQAFEIGREWQRVSLTVQPTSRYRYAAVGAGVDWSKAGPQPITVWLDDLQLEAGAALTDFTSRDTVEAGLCTDREGNVFFRGQPAVATLAVSNLSPQAAVVELTVTDFTDSVASRRRFEVPPGKAPWRRPVDLGLGKTGFYRVAMTVNGKPRPRAMRLAIIPRYTGQDSLFGVNHAWPWPHLERLAVAAGLGWARDWSNKWQHVQPAPGAPFDFSETDLQIDRARSFGQQVLGLLPFPSADWSSSAPASVAVTDRYPGIRERQAYAPRDEKEFRDWIGATVSHYRGRITWWQVFNEPLFTDYSLPASKGYTGEDYGKWVKTFAAAARAADPQCKILAGIGYWPDHVEKHFRGMFSTGALQAIDAVDMHLYPGLASPESQEPPLAAFATMMREYGPVRPLWLTEHGYYADDDPETDPLRHSGFDTPLPSERLQAAYAMRFNVMLLAHGVERIFYHAGTSPGLHEDNLEGTFFKYGGQPRRIYAALAAFAELFRPGVKPLRQLDWGSQAKAYLFRQDDRLILATWARRESPAIRVSWNDKRIVARDLMGNDLSERALTLTGDPVFLVCRGMQPEALETAVRHTAGQ